MAEWLLGIGWIYIDRLMDAQLHMVVERHDPCPKMNFYDLAHTQWLDLCPQQHITHTLREGYTCPAEPGKRPPLIHMEWCVWDGWLSDSEVELQECWTIIYVLGPLSDLSHHHTRHQVTLKHNGYSETTLNTPLCFSERGCTISLPSWAWKSGSWLSNSGWK